MYKSVISAMNFNKVTHPCNIFHEETQDSVNTPKIPLVPLTVVTGMCQSLSTPHNITSLLTSSISDQCILFLTLINGIMLCALFHVWRLFVQHYAGENQPWCCGLQKFSHSHRYVYSTKWIHRYATIRLEGHLGCFQFRAVLNSIAVAILVTVLWWTFTSQGCVPRSRIPAAQDGDMFDFNSYCQSGYTTLHTNQQQMVPVMDRRNVRPVNCAQSCLS